MTVELAAQSADQITLKCFVKTFVKVDPQIEGRVPTDFLLSERVFLPKTLLQETELSETYGEYS